MDDEQEFQFADTKDNERRAHSLDISMLENHKSADSDHNNDLVYTFDPNADSKSGQSSGGNLSKKSSSSFEMDVTQNQPMMCLSQKEPSLSISIDGSVRFPSVMLNHSPRGQRPLKVRIPMYKTTTFMKMQTQMFVLDVTDPNRSDREYQIERRFSDFVVLYQSLFYNQPGFILCPFPDKSFTSFFNLKLGIGISGSRPRSQLIEMRMGQLENFINYVTNHPLLRNSEEIAMFLQENGEKHFQGMNRLEKYVEENQSLERPSSFQNWLGKSKQLWQSYMGKQSPVESSQIMPVSQNNSLFATFTSQIKDRQAQIARIISQMNDLYKTQRSFSEFSDFNTDNDQVLKLCAKHSSCRDYCKSFCNILEINILEELHFNQRTFVQAQKVLEYRLKMGKAYAEASNKDTEKKNKLMRRIQLLEKNFIPEWEEVGERLRVSTKTILQSFEQHWQNHKASMRKVWKKKQ